MTTLCIVMWIKWKKNLLHSYLTSPIFSWPIFQAPKVIKVLTLVNYSKNSCWFGKKENRRKFFLIHTIFLDRSQKVTCFIKTLAHSTDFVICRLHMKYEFFTFVCLCTDIFLPNLVCLPITILPAAFYHHCLPFQCTYHALMICHM